MVHVYRAAGILYVDSLSYPYASIIGIILHEYNF